MSRDLTSEGADRTSDTAASDGMYQPGRTQRETLLMLLRQAAEYEQWKTLAELADLTRFPPASISAQLRHLRKARYGAWGIEKRRREWVREETVWEYRLTEGRTEITK